MASGKPDLTRPLGGPPQVDASRLEAAAEWVGAGVALVWILAVFLWGLGLGQLSGWGGMVFLTFSVLLPIAMLGLIVLLLRQLHDLRGAAARLAEQIQALRQAEARETAARAVRTDAAARAPAAGQFASRRDPGLSQISADGRQALTHPAPAGPGEDQPALALATPTLAEAPPLDVGAFIRAIQFPESAEDAEGFAALRRALADRTAAKLIRAAQDVLTLLAQDGIYMDDLAPDLARPEIWRRFANGERGRSIAALGGIRDRSCLALTGQKMREDPVFRDAAHHFLRSFDRAFSEIAPRAADEEIVALSDTRSARAFMLVGRVAGTFD